MNHNNKYSLGNAKEQNELFQERKNPVQKLTKLINQYHSIDLMEATKEEKNWAKQRLSKEIIGTAKWVNSTDQFKSKIKSCLNSRDIWEDIKNSLHYS